MDVEVGDGGGAEFGCAQAGIEEDEDDGAVAFSAGEGVGAGSFAGAGVFAGAACVFEELFDFCEGVGGDGALVGFGGGDLAGEVGFDEGWGAGGGPRVE